MVRWRIYYHDGSTFGDLDGTPELAPKSLRVLTVIQEGGERDRVKQEVRAVDNYWWVSEAQGWYGGDQYGLWDYLFSDDYGPRAKVALLGRSVRDEDYGLCRNAAAKWGVSGPPSGRWKE